MASLNGVSSSNSLSSLMRSANMISGLASGMDTEGMIENLVKSYQMKINQYNQKITKVEWKQDAYRSIISKMVSLADKYTSYTSSTNLMSRSFFNNAVTVSTLGKYADAVSASGKTSSNISLNSVTQLATAASYRTQGNLEFGDGRSIEASGKGFDLNGKTELATLSGSMTLTYGSQKISINFDQVADVKAMEDIRNKLNAGKGVDEAEATDAEVLAELINQKLSGQTISLSGGTTADATDRIEVSVQNGTISFKDKSTAGNSVFISGASGNVASQLGISSALEKEDKDKPRSFSFSGDLTYKENNGAYLSGRRMNLNLDGVTKTIYMPRVYADPVLDEEGEPVLDEDSKAKMRYYLDADHTIEYNAENYMAQLSEAVDKAFGGKVKVSNALEGTAGYDPKTSTDLKLRFDVQEGSSLVINTDVGETLGIGRTATSYLNTNKTLGDLLDKSVWGNLTSTGKQDKNGNDLYAFRINGVTVGTYSKDSKLSELMDDINKSDAGVKVSYSQTTKNFLFEAKETGADSKVDLGGGLASAMFGTDIDKTQRTRDYLGLDEDGLQGKTFAIKVGDKDISFEFQSNDGTLQNVLDKVNGILTNKGVDATASFDNTGALILTDSNGKRVDYKVAEKEDNIAAKLAEPNNGSYTKGQDAIFNVTVNGETINMTRSSNTVNIDGMSITMKDTFKAETAGEAVTFKSSTDSDKIVDAIKEMVNDYNAMMAEIKAAYSTMPYQKSSGAFGNYEPLTEDEMEGMTEGAIARYEEKAKQGILFGDQTLSTLYDKLNQVFSFNNKADVDTLKDMGITVSFSISGGTQAVTIDEEKLRSMLDSDPDRVADLFTKTDGVMDRMKTQLDNYAKTTGEPKGILIQQAGSPLSSLSLLNNFWQQEIDNYNTQIEKWQTKLESQVERYTSQFARLEQLIAQMNNQSSALAGLMGG